MHKTPTSAKIFVCAVTLAVSACGEVDTRPVAAKSSIQRQPGSWQMQHYTMAFEASEVTGGMAEMVKAGQASIGKKELSEPLCLNAAQAASDDLTARLQEAIRFGPEWKIVRSYMTGGTIDFFATMDDSTQGHGEMTITGSITPTTTDLVLTTDSWQPAPGKGHIHVVMKQENTWKGDCTPGQDDWR